MEIAQAQKDFEHCFKANARMMSVSVGHRGESHQMEVAWLPAVRIWAGSKKLDNRYWNAFGVGKPDLHSANSISCEINFPLAGINRRIAGVLAKDEKGIIWVCHRGGIGGGKEGVGPSFFWNHFEGKRTLVWDDEVAIIGAISMPDFLVQLSNFVKFVHRIKQNMPPNKKH